jgi:hypothetical protein
MVSRRFIALLVVAAAGLAAIVALAVGAADDTAGRATAPGAATVLAVAATPTATAPAAATPQAGTATPATADDVLAAVRTLKRFCDLVDGGRRGAAVRLLSGPWVWPRRELESITGLRFVSARVRAEALADGVVLLARVHATLRGPSPLHRGVNTLFFTLGRDGTTGGWLITAVTTSP